jgi:hypothetical protein
MQAETYAGLRNFKEAVSAYNAVLNKTLSSGMRLSIEDTLERLKAKVP